MESLKRVETGFYPTPLHDMPNLSKKLGKGRLLIKRDDLTGLAFGGNKARKLDYIVADALDKGYTALLTYGGPQTNHGRMTAAAAAKFGMKSIIMCYGEPPKEATGNIVLDRMLGAEVCFMKTDKVRSLPKEKIVEGYMRLKNDSTQCIIDKYEAQGEKVYIVPIGGHSVIGTVGYIMAVKEIMNQLKEQNISADYLVTGYGSTGTYAGLWIGAKYFNAPFKLIGVGVAPLEVGVIKRTTDFINEACKELELDITCTEEELLIEGNYFGDGYNIPDNVTREYMYLLAREEGIFVDPCYTGKTFRGFVDLIESGKIPQDKTAIYLHTGGTPAIWTKEHLEAMQEEIWYENVTVFDLVY